MSGGWQRSPPPLGPTTTPDAPSAAPTSQLPSVTLGPGSASGGGRRYGQFFRPDAHLDRFAASMAPLRPDRQRWHLQQEAECPEGRPHTGARARPMWRWRSASRIAGCRRSDLADRSHTAGDQAIQFQSAKLLRVFARNNERRRSC